MLGTITLLALLTTGWAVSQEKAPAGKEREPSAAAERRARAIEGAVLEARTVIIAYEPGAREAVAEEVKAAGLEVVEVFPEGNALLARWPDQAALRRALPRLLDLKGVRYVEPNGRVTIPPMPRERKGAFAAPFAAAPVPAVVRVIPNDPEYPRLYGMEAVRASQAWTCVRSSKAVVAVVDTGVDYAHEDLRENMWVNPYEIAGDGLDNDGNGVIDDVFGYNAINNSGNPADDNGHGTHCAGTVGAVGNNYRGVAGVAWRARIMAVKFLDAGGSGTFLDGAKAIDYAVRNGARVISASWGAAFRPQIIRDAVDRAHVAGVLFVAAAGNNGTDNDAYPFYPASFADPQDLYGQAPNVISVAATDPADALAGFSNYGKRSVLIAAPGVDIYSTLPASTYGYLSGTSMATPHVAGGATLLLGHPAHATSGVRDLKGMLLRNSRKVPTLKDKTATEGILDLSFLCPPCPPCPPPIICYPQHRSRCWGW